MHIKRREFLKSIGLGAAVCATGCAHLPFPRPRAAQVIPGRIPKHIPGRLKMNLPDAEMLQRAAGIHPFDLQARMALAASAMTCCTDPELGYIGCSQIHFDTKPPHMVHCVGDFVDDMGRHTDALWLIRNAIGRLPNEQVVRKITQNAMDVVEDGIAWNPRESPYGLWGQEAKLKDRWTHLPEASRIFLGLETYHRATGDSRAQSILRSMIRRHYEIAGKNEKWLWYFQDNYIQQGNAVLPCQIILGEPLDFNAPTPPSGMVGLLLFPIIRYYASTRDPIAGEIAIKFSRLIVDVMPDFIQTIEHVHSRLSMIAGVLLTGEVCGIPEYSKWAEARFEEFLALEFVPDFGWTPERMSRPRHANLLCTETCTAVDFLELSLLMALHRDEKYWDVAERIAMNQLLENQLLCFDFLERLPPNLLKPFPPNDPQRFITGHMPERCLGGFASFAGPNDWIQTGEEQALWAVQCCFGSGGRGLYDVWHYSAEETTETVRVNLQFSKRLPSALILSHMPGSAALDIEMTGAKRLLVRKPGWADAAQTRITVDGESRIPPMTGSYFDFGVLPRGARVNLAFPNEIISRKERIGEAEFSTQWRGNAVVAMKPAGSIYPLYQNRSREHCPLPLDFINPQPVNPL